MIVSRLVRLTVALAIFATISVSPLYAQIFVKADATGANNGSSWLDAFTDLQDALAVATYGDEIWVAAATYVPTAGTDETETFHLRNGVALYGGFDGTEATLAERDFTVNVTILSGEIGDPGDVTDNCFHVLTADNCDTTTVFDGFTVTGGYADGPSTSVDRWGAGMFITGASLTMQNIVFDDNHAETGGGVFIRRYGLTTEPVIADCVFSNNTASTGGGAHVHYDTDALFVDCTFSANSADAGGGVYAQSGTIRNVQFVGNSAQNRGGGCDAQRTLFEDVTFENNTAERGGGLYIMINRATVDGGTFEGNVATIEGGGIYDYNADLLKDLTLSNNSAVRGGGIYSAFGDVYDNLTFTGNTATEAGGGMYKEQGNGAMLGNMTFTDNSAPKGGGIYTGIGSGAGATIFDVTLDGNSADEGGGIYCSNDIGFRGITLTNNTATIQGGGMFNSGAPPMVDVVFQGNTSIGDGGGMVNDGSPIMFNTLFWANTSSGDGGAMANRGAGGTIANVTFCGNDATGSGGALFNDGANPLITNTISWNNSAATGAEVHNTGGSAPTISFSNIEGSGGSGGGWNPAFGADGGGNRDADPLFVDPVGGDFELMMGSPSIETGDNTVPGLPGTDLAGDPRIQNVFVDMGAYESSMFCPLTSLIFVDPNATLPGNGASWTEALPDLRSALIVAHGCPGVTEIWVVGGTYTPTATADRTATFAMRSGLAIYGGFSGGETSLGERDPDANPVILSGEIGASGTTDNSYHVVTASGTDASALLDGFVITMGSANNVAPNDVGAGLVNIGGSPTLVNLLFEDNEAYTGGGGLYSSSGDPMMTNVTFIDNAATGGNGGGMYSDTGNPTMVDISFSNNSASAAGGGMYSSQGDPVMTDVTFSGNSATGNGGGMYNSESNPSMTDVSFDQNTSLGNGGAMYNSSSSWVGVNAFFVNNTALSGGGVYNYLYSDAILTNAVFANNTALTGPGGGMSNVLSTATITNATFGENSASNSSGGALYNAASNHEITNTVLWGNSAPTGPQIQNQSSTPVISYSLIEASGGSGAGWDPALGTDGGNNLDADPLFVDAPGNNLRLQTGSPAVDTGDNSAPNLPATDLDGNARVIGAAVDMGAYELDEATGIDPFSPRTPHLALNPPYPNPFNPTVTVVFELDRKRQVRISVYDVAGRLVREVLNETRSPGLHEVTWDARRASGAPVTSGVFFVRMESEGWHAVTKVVLLK